MTDVLPITHPTDDDDEARRLALAWIAAEIEGTEDKPGRKPSGSEVGDRFPRTNGTPRSDGWGRKLLRTVTPPAAPTPAPPDDVRFRPEENPYRHTEPVGTWDPDDWSGRITAMDDPYRQHEPPGPAERPEPEPDPSGVVTGWVRHVTIAAGTLVAVVAAVVSFAHQVHVAAQANDGMLAWLVPLSVDGLIVVASMTIMVRRRAGDGVGLVPWVSLILGVGASCAANVTSVVPAWLDHWVVEPLVAVWPPLALALSAEMLFRLLFRAPTKEND